MTKTIAALLTILPLGLTACGGPDPATYIGAFRASCEKWVECGLHNPSGYTVDLCVAQQVCYLEASVNPAYTEAASRMSPCLEELSCGEWAECTWDWLEVSPQFEFSAENFDPEHLNECHKMAAPSALPW